ncbi:MAG: hypothetical protein KKH37_02440, partial [Alphaproteobacteria bacterium]|nr:hypothetical protein [Alphaproteobacteria bacterium]
MSDLTRNSDRLIEEARALRDDNRSGGRHRRAVSIGKGSAAAKQKHWIAKIRNIVIALFAIWVAAGVLGMVLDGIGFAGVMALVLASVVAIAVLGKFPRMKTPRPRCARVMPQAPSGSPFSRRTVSAIEARNRRA